MKEVLKQAPESTYHPCTSILIEGLKKLKAWDVLAEWDQARDIVDKTRDQAIEDEWNVDEAMSTAMFDIEDHFGI